MLVRRREKRLRATQRIGSFKMIPAKDGDSHLELGNKYKLESRTQKQGQPDIENCFDCCGLS
jgi:hypothetical protein